MTVLGVDVSTTAAKAIAVGADGRTLSEGRASFALENPSPGAWEQDAKHWKRAMFEAIRSAVVGVPGIRALAIANQRETFAVTDEDGTPLAPAIVWMDARSTPEVRAVTAQTDPDRILDISGKVPCTTPSLYKIRMLLERLRPDLRPTAKRVTDVHGFCVHALTGRWVTSTAAADPLGIVDMRTGAFSDELCALARVRREELCELVHPGTVIGKLLPEVATQLGLSRDVVVVAGAGDGQAAGLGAGASKEGVAYLNLGTAVVAGVPSNEYRVSRSFRTLFGAVPGTYLFESDLKGGTLTLDWLVDRVLGAGRFERTDARMTTLAALEQKAAALTPGASGLLALPYWAGVMNPHWDDDASGALVGLRADHGPEHLYRAICEGLAFEHRMIFERIEAETKPIAQIVAVGGGARSAFVSGLFASVLERSLSRCETDEITALGAAILAAPHGGLATSIEDAARAMVRVVPGAEPGPDRDRYRELYERGYRGLYDALAPVLRELAAHR